MRKAIVLMGAAWLGLWTVAVETRQGLQPNQLAVPPAREPGWAWPIQQVTLPHLDPEGPRQLPGSARTYTQVQIDNLMEPPDWFPNDHPAPPQIVVKGHGTAIACGSCHLMSGSGHPESGDVAGLPVDYFVRQAQEFRSGVRTDIQRMNSVAKDLSDEEIMEAATYFAALKPLHNNTVVERDMVPKTVIGQGRMRLLDPAGGTEPVGDRIITVPVDLALTRMRDPATKFVSYVATGTLARGENLVEKGDRAKKIVACGVCHGKDLGGQTMRGANAAPGTIVPRIAGMHPYELVRQLTMFRDGSRGGPSAKPMAPTAAGMTDADILAIAAYVASVEPTAPRN